MTHMPKARLKIKIEGEWMPYTEGAWVIFSKQGFPVGFMYVELRHLKPRAPGAPVGRRQVDRPKAFRDFWRDEPGGSASFSMDRALDGYTIELVGRKRRNELLDIHLGGRGGRPTEQLTLPDETPEP